MDWATARAATAVLSAAASVTALVTNSPVALRLVIVNSRPDKLVPTHSLPFK